MADFVVTAIQLTRNLLAPAAPTPSEHHVPEDHSTTVPTTIKEAESTTKEVHSLPNMGLYFGIGCGIVVAAALMGIAYLFLKDLIARKKKETIALSDLRQYACQSRGRSCSPDFSPAGRSTLNSDESRSPVQALSPDWRSISPDGPLSPPKSL